MPDPATPLLDVLADATRRTIFESLAARAQTVGEITSALPVSQSAVSQHLGAMSHAGLVRGERHGRHVVYAVRPEALAALRDYYRSLAELAGLAAAADEHDHVDTALQRWGELWPEFDAATVALIARLLLVGRLMDGLTSRTAARHGIAKMDVIILGTLRRLGPPHQSTATELSKIAVLSPPGMSQRLGWLEQQGLVRRLPSPDDGRASVVRLTAKGIAVNDRVVREQMGGNYAAFFQLPQAERQQLARSLRRLLRRLEDAAPPPARRTRIARD